MINGSTLFLCRTSGVHFAARSPVPERRLDGPIDTPYFALTQPVLMILTPFSSPTPVFFLLPPLRTSPWVFLMSGVSSTFASPLGKMLECVMHGKHPVPSSGCYTCRANAGSVVQASSFPSLSPPAVSSGRRLQGDEGPTASRRPPPPRPLDSPSPP